MAGSYWCFKTMDTTPISLPGRKADFWLWALDPQIATVDALRAYLENLQTKTAQNDALNADIVVIMRRAKVAGMCAPLAAIGGALVAVIVRAI